VRGDGAVRQHHLALTQSALRPEKKTASRSASSRRRAAAAASTWTSQGVSSISALPLPLLEEEPPLESIEDCTSDGQGARRWGIAGL
jgi:hypothetical protein